MRLGWFLIKNSLGVHFIHQNVEFYILQLIIKLRRSEMKTIYPAYKTVSTVCGYQKNLQGATRLTRHCLRIPCPEGKLFYHTLTGELILLETGENVDQCRTELIRHRFLVPEDCNDTEYADQVRNTLNLIKQETSLKSCLMPMKRWSTKSRAPWTTMSMLWIHPAKKVQGP